MYVRIEIEMSFYTYRQKSQFFLPVKNGFNAALWCFFTQSVEQIKSATDKSDD